MRLPTLIRWNEAILSGFESLIPEPSGLFVVSDRPIQEPWGLLGISGAL